MSSNALTKAAAGPANNPALQLLRAEGATRIDLARDDRWPPVKTVAAGLGAAAALAAFLTTLALF
jgi:hypothetical protein